MDKYKIIATCKDSTLNKVEMVKALRADFGFGLRQAKEAVDSHMVGEILSTKYYLIVDAEKVAFQTCRAYDDEIKCTFSLMDIKSCKEMYFDTTPWDNPDS